MKNSRNAARITAALVASSALALGTATAIAAGGDGVKPAQAKLAPVQIPKGATVTTKEGEMPSWLIPNLPIAAEAYFGPDSRHLIAQVASPKALKSPRGMMGFLTQTFTDEGTDIKLINDKGWDACSYFFPDGKRLVWTAIKDHLDLPIGNWSEANDYPLGAELYVSDLDGNNVKRLTDNKYYEAEVTVSPDNSTIVFGRQIDRHMSLWLMNADGTNERQLIDMPEWEPGAPYFLPDNETIIFRAWKRADVGKRPTPMTIFLIKRDGTGLRPVTRSDDMNWAPYPAPDGEHFVYVRALDGGANYEVFLGNYFTGEARRLTFDSGFDGFPSISPDGRKMVWTSSRTTGKGFMGLKLHVMDITSLNIGPKKR